MTLLSTVRLALSAWPEARLIGSSVLVPTHCLYPSGGVVSVRVDGGVDTFGISDGAGAVEVLEGAGGHDMPNISRIVRSLAKRNNLLVDRQGAVYSPPVKKEDLVTTIVVVANASKQIAEHLLQHYRPHLDRNFRTQLDHFLKRRFGEKISSPVLAGARKPHRIDYLIPLGDNRRLALDAVVPDASSINSAIVAHIDLRDAKIVGLEQRLVFDDSAPWKAADLNLLRVGAAPVAFSRLPEIIGSLAITSEEGGIFVQ
jgi:hypothetical protein